MFIFRLQVHQFWPLVRIKCSPDLQFFLCSMYAPICVDNYDKHLPVCRSVCERAKAGCAPLMQQYGFQWPERMACDLLPEHGDKNQLCMSDHRKNDDDDDGGGGGSRSRAGATRNYDVMLTTTLKPVAPTLPECGCYCRMVPIDNTSHPLYNGVITGGDINCAMTCKTPYFTADEMSFAQIWLSVWSILCLASTFVTVVTFCVDTSRFQYPERPIIFLSGCYTMISTGFIIRLALGHEAMACDTSTSHDGDDDVISTIRYATNGPALCTTVFLLVYFFSMASSMWWVVLSFTWFLAAGLKWGQEAIASYSQYFHLIAWLVPSIKSIVILALKYVDGDPVAGICFVGNQNITNLRVFVILPLCAYLLIGTTFLVAGFISLFRIRTAIRQQGQAKTAKLEKLMIRIGIFSVLYTVPATIVIACYIYEQHFRIQWEVAYNCPCEEALYRRPNYSIFVLKYFMCLVVGITSGFWIWSSKTVDSWRKFYRTVCCCNKRQEVYVPPLNTHARMLHTKYPQYPSPPLSNNSTYQSVKTLPYTHV